MMPAATALLRMSLRISVAIAEVAVMVVARGVNCPDSTLTTMGTATLSSVYTFEALAFSFSLTSILSVLATLATARSCSRWIGAIAVVQTNICTNTLGQPLLLPLSGLVQIPPGDNALNTALEEFESPTWIVFVVTIELS